MPKDQSAINLEVVYCGAWGGLPEANYASKVIRTVYPNAKINQYTPGKTRNLVIKYNGEEVYNKQNGDGAFTDQNAVKFLNKLKGITSKWFERNKDEKMNFIRETFRLNEMIKIVFIFHYSLIGVKNII